MHTSGLQAYERRSPERTGIYSFENRPKQLSPAYEKRFRQNKKAWKFFNEQPTYYKNLIIFRIMSAKKEETQMRRLEETIECSANEKRVGMLEKKQPQRGT
jgi:hypothetical protein